MNQKFIFTIRIKVLIMKHKDRIRNMTDDELCDFLRNFNWENCSEGFGKKYCDNCEPIIAQPEGYHNELKFAKCEFDDYACPYYGGDCIKWWLEQEENNEM